MSLPEGTVTFLRTDVVGSMELVRALGPRYDELNAEHHAIVRAALDAHGGQLVRTEGDAVFAVFTDAASAAHAAVAIQRAMADRGWPAGHPFELRMGLHSGVATRAGHDYGGFEVNRAARIAALGSGGQIVVSDPARALIAVDMADGWQLRDLGRVRLKGVSEPEHLYQLDAPGLPHDFQALRSIDDDARNLPVRLTTFIGRERELEELSGLLGGTRLLTLTGPGGTGKTTLALELARRHAADVADGAWFIDLQAVRDPEAVRAEIARGLGLHDGPAGSAADRLAEFVADRELLIVIDNFEQIVEAASDVGSLLTGSPRIRVVVTSRVPLRIRGEQEYAVRPLGLAPAGSDVGAAGEAVRLFVDRARSVRPDDDLGDSQLATVVDICRLLDGLPLAIELCAARAGLLPIAAIRDRLAKRLPMPGSGPRDLPDRQRTIEDTVAWSHELLEPPIQRLLARVSVFEGAFELEQAEAVCGPGEELGIDVLEGLMALAERSLLQRVDDAVGGIRFRMLETIRAFAAARLVEIGDEAALRGRHARAYAELAARESGDLMAADRPESIDRLEADDANLREAAAWAIAEGGAPLALPLVADLWRFWLGTGRLRDGLALARAGLDLPSARSDPSARIRGLEAAGGLAYWAGEMRDADACYQERLAMAQDIGDERILAEAWIDLAFTRTVLGDLEGGMEASLEAERRFLAIGDRRSVVRIAWVRTLGAASEQEPTERILALREIASGLAELDHDDPWVHATRLSVEGQIHLLEGDLAAAIGDIVPAFRHALRFRDHADIVIALQPVSVALLFGGLAETAALVLGASEGAAERFGLVSPAALADVTGVRDPEGAFRSALGDERFQTLRAEGRQLTLEEALTLIESIDVAELVPFVLPASETPAAG